MYYGPRFLSPLDCRRGIVEIPCMETMESINPATGETLRTYRPHSLAEIDHALDSAVSARLDWQHRKDKSGLLSKAASILKDRAAEWAALISMEMGKPVRQARAEVLKCALACDYFAANAAGFLADELVATEAADSRIRFEPLGAILAVMPWNFPFWQVFRCAAPALAAGNVVILKHSSNVPGCALAIERIFREAGFPDGVFSTLLIGSQRVAAIVKDRRVAAAALTGSDAAGRALSSAAGSALKKTILELGGSDPFIVMDDADTAGAALAASTSRFQNAGQSCIAAKRFIVCKGAYDDFMAGFTSAASRLKVGNPALEETDIGPLARADLLEDACRQTDESVSKGARIVAGGRKLEGPGFYFAPTILSMAGKGMPVWDEETFCPLAAVAEARDREEALALANSTRYGLGANVWTRNPETARWFSERLDAGLVFVNSFVKSDPRLPFGGVKESGYGRELSSYGIREFVNVKTVWVEKS